MQLYKKYYQSFPNNEIHEQTATADQVREKWTKQPL